MSTLRYWLQKALAVTLLSAISGAALAVEPLKILVFGGTGNIGQHIVREALDRGHRVTVVSREPSRVKEKHANLSAQQGNVLDSAQVAKLAAGNDVVISAIGADRANNPDYGIYRKAGQSLVTALRTLDDKAPRLIVVGGAGSLEIAPGVLLVTKVPERYRAEVLGQKDALEYYRTVKDVKWTYFSPAGSIEPGKRTGKFRLGGDQLVADKDGNSRISIQDYALALIDEAEQPKHIGKRFTIGY